MSFNYVLFALLIFLVYLLIRVRQSNKSTSHSMPSSQLTKPASSPFYNRQEETIKPHDTAQSDHLIVAQDFINQQRYDNAIQELKTGLSKQPDNSALMLKLLNVYAVTNSIEHFHSLYNQVLVKADSVTLQQAQNLKAMLDEEAKLQTHNKDKEFESPFTPNDVSDASALDFSSDLSKHEVATAFSAHSSSLNAEEEDLSFEDLEAQFLNDSQSTLPSDKVKDSAEHFNQLKAFSDLDDTKTDNSSIIDSSDSFEWGIEDSNKNSDDESNSDEFAFDNINKIEDVFKQESSINLSAEDTVSNPSEDIFEFSIDNDTDEDKDKVIKISEAPKSEECNFDLHRELPDNSPTLTEDNSYNGISDNASQKLESSEFLTFNQPVFEDIDSNKEETLPSLSEWVKNDSPNNDFVNETTKKVTNHSDYTAINPVEEDIKPNEVDKKSVAESQNFEIQDDELYQTFDFVKDLDSTQITLDLAQKYLELGEYDSAKRLINEVLESDASDFQKAQAERILTRIT